MSVRFLIGRAGTGKSAACAAEIHAELRRDPLGPPLLWITPEQATFTTERLLFASSAHPHAAFRAQVLGFRRLASLIGRDSGFLQNERIKPLGDLARLVLLEETVRAAKPRLLAFAPVADRPGFLEKLDATLRELRQYGHSGSSLRALLPHADPLSAAKLTDLALLLDAWTSALDAGTASWDVEKILEHAAARLPDSPWLCGTSIGGGAMIWIDGFSAMSALEVRLLLALARHAAHVTVTLTADPDSRPIRDLRCAPEEMTLFARTERLYCRLIDALGKEKIRIDAPRFLRTPHRFRAPQLHTLEAHLFSDTASPPPPHLPTLFSTDAVELWECSDPETEVRAAAQTIRALAVGPEQRRYRDIGLIVPDLAAYADAISRIFTEHRIPHFIDQRRTIAHHPLVELLRSAVAIRASHWDRDELLLYLKTGLTGIPPEDVALLENYLLAHGITRLSWELPWRWIAPNQTDDDLEPHAPDHARALLLRLNHLRAKVWNDLRGWTDHAPAADFIAPLQNLLARLNVPTQIEAWINAARHAGDPELAQIHEQASRQIQELLLMLDGLLQGRPRTLPEFAALLEGALETLTLALIPPTVDQVLVSSVTRSRVPELRVAILLGAVEGQFPKVAEEDPILSDAQRDLFNSDHTAPGLPGTAGGGYGGIGESAERQLMEMPFFDYQALTRASDRLIVSYPIADRRGRAIAKSRYIARLQDLLAGQLTLTRFDAASRTRIDHLATSADLLTAVVTWTRDLLRRRQETLAPTAQDGPMAQVYHWLTALDGTPLADARRWIWPCIAERPAPRLDQAMAQRFYPPDRDLRMSVSQLEKFAACPLQYFMHYTLGLRPRDMLEMDTLKLGVLYHRVLERLYRKIIAHTPPLAAWPDCDQAVLRAVVEAEVDHASAELHPELAAQTPAYEKTKARTKRLLAIVAEGQRRRALLGDLRPLGVEVHFGEGPDRDQPPPARLSLPVLRIATPAGRTVALNGKIDRVDASPATQVAVLDYKSASQKALELHLVYFGLTLQLPVYAVVMQALGHRDPIAALYIPLSLRRDKIKRLDQAAERHSDEFYQRQKPHGIIDARQAEHLDHTFVPGEKPADSPWFGLHLNKGGIIPPRGGLLDHDDFETVLAYVHWKIAAMADDLLRGHIAPAPFRSSNDAACERCDFSPLCPFDRVAGHYRNFPKLPREDLLTRMRAALQGSAP